MRELRFQATGLNKKRSRKRRKGDRPPTRAKAVGWVLVGLAALYVLGVGKSTGRVDIVSPASGFTTLEDQIPVTVKAPDSGAGTVTLDVNGSVQTLTAPGGLFDVQVSLVPGENIIIASADGVYTDPIKVIRKLRPVVRIDSPLANTSVTQNPIAVRGVVENRDGRAVTLVLNGTTHTVAVMGEQFSATGERFSATLPLEAGRNIIRAQVPDALLPAEVAVSLETDIAITYPPDGSTFEQQTVRVTGTVNNSNAAAITVKLNESRQTIAVRNGAFDSPVVLRVGENRIQAFAGDKSSKEIVVTRTLPPVIITLTSPQSGTTQEPSASVRGTIQNARSNNITVSVNDAERVVPVTGVGFSTDVPLKIGENRIRVSQGDAASKEALVIRKPLPVVIQIRSPQNGLTTEDSSVKVFGTITNSQGDTVTLTVNDSSQPLSIARGTFASTEQLAIGENRIRVSQGNTSSEVLVVRKRLPVVIRISSPQNGLTTEDSSVKVFGTITNSQGDIVTLTVNGSSQPLSIARGTFASTEQLAIGENRIRVSQGNTSSEVLVVRKRLPVVIRISSPQNGLTTEDSSVKVFGTITNSQGDTVTLTVNGSSRPLTIAGGTFASTEQLAMGENHIRVSQGNTSSEVLVVRKRLPVVIRISSPQSGRTTDSAVKLTGKVENAQDKAVAITVNGVFSHSVPLTDGSFTSVVELNPGMNVIKASVRGASDQITMVRAKVDTPRPRIIIDSPKDGEITGRRVLAVEGRVENVEAETITLTVNGKGLPVQTHLGSFQSKVTLSPGKNSIRASLGNVSDQVTVTLQVKDSPPNNPPDESVDECRKINCDCTNVKATLSISGTAPAGSVAINPPPFPFFASSAGGQSKRPPPDRQEQCREAESSLRKNCRATGRVEGSCPPNASGPNAWPKPKGKKQAGVRVFKKVFEKEEQEGVKKP